MSGLSRQGRPGPKPSNSPAGRLVEDFLEHVRAGGRSAWTHDTYARPLRGLFVPFADARGVTTADDLTPQLVQDFALQLNQLTNVYSDKPLSKASVRTYLKSVQQMLSWLKEQRKAEVEPKKVPLPPVRKVFREILTRDEIDTLEHFASRERDKLIIRLMGDYGMREGEVISIRLEDLVQKDRRYFVNIRGKTGERSVPIVTPGLWRRLKLYERSRPKAARTNRLFLTDRKYDGEWQPLREDGVYRLFQDAAKRAEFTRRVYPHLLRHSAITFLVDKGLSELMISRIMGVSLQVIQAHYWQSTDEANYDALMRVLEPRE